MNFLRIGLIALAALAAGWMTVGVGMANLRRSHDPVQALSFAPFDARAQGNEAERIFRRMGSNREQLADVEERARAALRRDPTVVDGWRLLGAIAQLRGEEERGRALMRFSERVSRRDLQTQLWLVNDAARAGQVDELLRHADTGLRTSSSGGRTLTPILIAVSTDRRLAARIAQLLAADPPWERDFAYQLTHSSLIGDSVPLLVAPLANGAVEREIMMPTVQRLATARDYDNAWRVYQLLKPGETAAPAAVRDGSFDKKWGIAPFDWSSPLEGPVAAERRVRADAPENVALFLRAAAGTTGEGARQMLLLPPGRYSLAFAAGSIADVGAAAVDWQLSCAGEPPVVLSQGRHLPTRPAGSRQSISFAVPPGCPAQLLVFSARSDDQISASESWIDEISVARQ